MNNNGFTLIEAMLAASILFIGIAVVMSSLSGSFTINLATEEQNKLIAAMQKEVERLKTMTLSEIETEFGSSLDLVTTFDVEGLTSPDGSGSPETGTITASSVPGYTNNELVEFTLRIEYSSEVGGSDVEEIIVWISPNY